MPAARRAPQDEPSLATLVQQNHAFVWRYLRFLGCDAALADDLTQETFVAVLSRERRIAERALRSYLRRVAGNLFRRVRRRRHPQVELVDDTVAEVAFDLFQGGDDGGAYLTGLRACLATLDDRGRQVVQWRYGEELSRGEIAERLGIRDSGVKSLLQRTLARLRRCIQQRTVP